MNARTLLLPLALTLGVLLAAACDGGGGDGQQPTGRLTDPSSVPTATPRVQEPEPIILEPGSLTPVSGDEGGDGAEGTATPTASGECGDTYIVEAGDVPFTIAEKCGVDVNDLLELNGIDDPTTLRVGQELKIPPP